MSAYPDSPAARDDGQLRAALRLMASRLTMIHRALIDEATAMWAISTGAPPPGPLELFRLLREDAAFAWLQPITRLILEIEDLAARELDPVRSGAATEQLAALLDAGDSQLATSYRALLQRDVEFAGAHAELRGAMKSVRAILAMP